MYKNHMFTYTYPNGKKFEWTFQPLGYALTIIWPNGDKYRASFNNEHEHITEGEHSERA
jgi:hypothetical protein